MRVTDREVSTLGSVPPGGKLTAAEAPFVGRSEELELVSGALQAARTTRPQILVVEGAAGIGKTAFVRRCLAAADDVVVLEASGDEAESALHFGVVSQLFAQAALTRGGGPRAPRLGTGLPGSSFAVGAELLGMLEALQAAGPVVVLLDDAHWIDAASAAALLFALRRLHLARVCVVIATRPEGAVRAGPSWSRLLDDHDRVQRVRLGGLGGAEVALLADLLGGPPLSPAAAERLRRHTDGHPLYVKALLRELSPEALALEQGPLPAPHSFAATVLVALTSAASDTQDLVAAAAVAGGRCPVQLAGGAADLADPLAALDEALAAGLLTLVPGRIPTEVTFPHPLVRAAIYDDLSPTRRRDLHLACARLTAGSVALSHRAAASPGADDRLAAELVHAAEAEIARGELTLGVDHLLLASRVAAPGPTQETALLEAVDCLGVAGDVPRAQELREAVAACADTPRRSFSLATLTASAGRVPEALSALRAVTERSDFAAHPELAGPVFSSLAIVAAYAGDAADAIAWARRVPRDESATGTVQVTARQALALGLAISGRGREAVRELGALSPSRIAPEPFEAELLATRGAIKVRSGDLAGGVDDLVAVITWARSGATARSLPNAHSSLAEAEYRLGRWDDGSNHAELGILLAQDSHQVWELPFAHAVASLFHAGRGEWSPAAEQVAAARRVASAAPLPVSGHYARYAAASLARVREDWSGVLVVLEGPAEKMTPSPGPALHHQMRVLEAEALVRSARLDEAADVLAALAAAVADGTGAVIGVDVCRVRGALEHARGDHAHARAAFAAGQEIAARAGSPLAEAELELAFGRFLRRTGRRSTAAARLQTARSLFERMRAQPFLDACDAELAACGLRTPAAGGDGYGLSPREQAVARLVAAGKSNREVGEELYLSTKAIEYHLSNIFTKLGVHSRHQLASRVGTG